MKRRSMKTIVCAALLTLAMSVTACGGSKKTLEEYMKADQAAMQELESQMEAMGDESTDMAVEITGNNVVYTATLKEGYEVPEENIALMEESLDTMESAFVAIAGALDEEIGADKGTVLFGIKYCNPDGSVLVEKSYKAQ